MQLPLEKQYKKPRVTANEGFTYLRLFFLFIWAQYVCKESITFIAVNAISLPDSFSRQKHVHIVPLSFRLVNLSFTNQNHVEFVLLS